MVYEPGPFERDHGYVQWGGSLPGGEQWSCGLRVACTEGISTGPGAADGWDMAELLDHYTETIKAMHINPNAKINNRAKLDHVKFNRIGVDGHYLESVTYEEVFAPLSGGDAGQAVYHPNQVALVVSLTTDVNRGPAHRGRFYLPLPNCIPADDGLITVNDANTINGCMAAFLQFMADTPGIDTASDPGVVVMSRKLGSPATRRVTGCHVGRVMDTQRRRRRSLNEAYVSSAVMQGAF